MATLLTREQAIATVGAEAVDAVDERFSLPSMENRVHYEIDGIQYVSSNFYNDIYDDGDGFIFKTGLKSSEQIEVIYKRIPGKDEDGPYSSVLVLEGYAVRAFETSVVADAIFVCEFD
jgi:hypothetical protein